MANGSGRGRVDFFVCLVAFSLSCASGLTSATGDAVDPASADAGAVDAESDATLEDSYRADGMLIPSFDARPGEPGSDVSDIDAAEQGQDTDSALDTAPDGDAEGAAAVDAGQPGEGDAQTSDGDDGSDSDSAAGCSNQLGVCGYTGCCDPSTNRCVANLAPCSMGLICKGGLCV